MGDRIEIDLDGRVALVTGGTRGIGRGIATTLLAAGATVVVCGRNEPGDPVAVDGRSARFVTADVRDDEDVERLVADVVDTDGRLDLLVNNAGGAPHRDVVDASARHLRAVVDLNLVSAMVLSAAAARAMVAGGGGSIVNVASVSGTRPSPGTAAYGAAKAGLVSLTTSMAVELAPDVRVNAVTPGLIATEASVDHYGGQVGMDRVAATVPLGRFGTPDDIGGAVAWLASDHAAYVTGANLVLHGGGEWPAFLRAAAGS